MMGKLDGSHNYRHNNNGGNNERRALTHIRKPPRMEYSRTAEKGSAASRTAQKISFEKKGGFTGRREEDGKIVAAQLEGWPSAADSAFAEKPTAIAAEAHPGEGSRQKE